MKTTHVLVSYGFKSKAGVSGFGNVHIRADRWPLTWAGAREIEQQIKTQIDAASVVIMNLIELVDDPG